MIKNQWYAVLSSKEVKAKRLVAARRFGENLVFFRNKKGDLGCVADLCAHRGASLEKGCVTDGKIKCPFHGIEYDVSGRCVHIPSEGRASVQNLDRFHLKHYETREIGGIIFAWYGDKAPDHEPDVFPVVTDPAFSYDHMYDEWSVQYSRVVENQLDVSHLAFVHPNTIGRGNRTLVNGPKVVWKDENTLQTSADNEKDEGQTPKSADDSKIKSTNLTFKFPNLWLNHVNDKIMILAFFVPVDEEHSLIALRFYNRITGIHAIDQLIAKLGSIANKIIERQDKRVVETQVPKATAQHMKENLVAADRPILEYRRRRYELQNGDGKNETIEATQNVDQDNIEPKPEKAGKPQDGQTIWRCRICGYEYVGEELPDDFVCPVCKHPKEDFEKIAKD